MLITVYSSVPSTFNACMSVGEMGTSSKPNYTLDDFDTSDYHLVSDATLELLREIFPEVDGSYIPRYYKDVAGMFAGAYKNYQAMDTVYHDLEHTLQATLCWVRMMVNRHRLRIEPMMTPDDFEEGFVGILMHDVGYLKEEGDHDGTGAKFTFVHERRSCEFADIYLEEQGWPKKKIFAVQHLISCTGPRSLIDSIPFINDLERIMGEAVCTADYLGQMSDPRYISKLPVLFEEFEESDDFRGIPKEDRIFKSSEALLRGTPFFWEKIVIPKLEKDCSALHEYLAEPYPDGINPYLQKIEENINGVRKIYEEEGAS